MIYEPFEPAGALNMKPFYTLRAVAALGAFLVFLWSPACAASQRG
jgi:hypothetical protein